MTLALLATSIQRCGAATVPISKAYYVPAVARISHETTAHTDGGTWFYHKNIHNGIRLRALVRAFTVLF